MMKEYLTVRDYADQLHISVQAVYKRINKGQLKPFIKYENGKIYIDKAALNPTEQIKEENNSNAVEILKAELEEKNKQIENLLNRLDQQQELLNQQQQLMLLDKQKIILLEEKTERKGIFSFFRKRKVKE